MSVRINEKSVPTAPPFTLIELLVVVAIIAVLASLLLPALSKARNRVKITTCANNQKQTFMALFLYSDDFTEYPSVMSTSQKDTYDNNNRVSGDDSNGEVAMVMLETQKYIAAASTQCSEEASSAGGNAYGWFRSKAWFQYNGPATNGWAVTDRGHNSIMNKLGKHDRIFGNWQTSTWGVDIGFRNYGKSRSGGKWDTTQIAIVGCAAILHNVPDPGKIYFEPHLNHPVSAVGNAWVNGSTNIQHIRRNYTFADGHVKFIQYDGNPPAAWDPK